MQILVAEDSLFARKAIVGILQGYGHNVFEVANGVDALNSFWKLRPDLVFMDIAMPHINGLDATKVITAAEPKAKVVILTALADTTNVLQAVRNGAIDFIVKPFDEARLMQVVNRVQEINTTA
ncbi:MAG: response regulator [Bacillota bacterium]